MPVVPNLSSGSSTLFAIFGYHYSGPIVVKNTFKIERAFDLFLQTSANGEFAG
jgi:hypothetical protein